jgi:ketosteroid isomerase-like protein
MQVSKNLQVVLDILKNEVDGDIEAAIAKVTPDYSMTWVEKTTSGNLFPSEKMERDKGTEEIYAIKNRSYDIRNIAEGENVVMLELIESYPDPETEEIYRTPLVLVLEMKDGKIQKGRHYCDSKLSYAKLSLEQIERDALKGTSRKLLID